MVVSRPKDGMEKAAQHASSTLIPVVECLPIRSWSFRAGISAAFCDLIETMLQNGELLQTSNG
jgi:hypothetical protein